MVAAATARELQRTVLLVFVLFLKEYAIAARILASVILGSVVVEIVNGRVLVRHGQNAIQIVHENLDLF